MAHACMLVTLPAEICVKFPATFVCSAPPLLPKNATFSPSIANPPPNAPTHPSKIAHFCLKERIIGPGIFHADRPPLENMSSMVVHEETCWKWERRCICHLPKEKTRSSPCGNFKLHLCMEVGRSRVLEGAPFALTC